MTRPRASRAAESAELDACTMETLTTLFAESGHDLRELLVALTQTHDFAMRK